MNGKAQSQKKWIAGGAAGAVLIAAASWLLLIHPEMSSTSSLKSQTNDVELQNDLLTHKVSDLRKQNEQLDQLNKTLADKVKELPAEPEVQEYSRQLVTQTQLTHVSLTGIVAGAPTVAGLPGAAATANTVANPAGKLFAIPLSITTNGSLQQQRTLLAALQKVGPRRALISSVEFSPKSGAGANASSNIDTANQMVIQVSVFVAPQTPAQEAALEKQLGTN